VKRDARNVKRNQTFLSTLFFSFRKRKEKRDQKKRKGAFTFFFSFVPSKEIIGIKSKK
jgi:hypothetical protein